jgi:hypothetical protein
VLGRTAANTDADSDSDADAYANTDAYSYADADADTDGHADAYCDADAADGTVHTHPDRHGKHRCVRFDHCRCRKRDR